MDLTFSASHPVGQINWRAPIDFAVRLAVMVAALAGCTNTVVPGALSPPAAPPPTFTRYTPSITAHSYGTVHISGSVRNDGYNLVASSAGGDQPVEISHGAYGDEGKHCGSMWRASQSQSVARFSPQHTLVVRDYGFSLLVDPRAHGGWFRQKSIGPICGEGVDTTGIARADVQGVLQVTFNGEVASKESLIIRIEGSHAHEANVQVKDVSGHVLRLKKNDGKGFIAELPKRGPYQITASLSAEVSASGDCPTCDGEISKSVTVHVQSMRDALALGFGDALHSSFKTPLFHSSFKIPFPVFVSVKDLEEELKNGLFNEEDGRFYPCKPDDECGARASLVYLKQPQLSIEGAWVILKAQLAGAAKLWKVFNLEVGGEIYLSGVPKVSRNVLFLESVAIEAQSRNDLVKYVSEEYGDILRAKVQAAARLDLKPMLNKKLEEAQSHFPIKLGNACLILSPTDLNIEAITTRDSPEDQKGIVVQLSLLLQEGHASECQGSSKEQVASSQP